jgi:hypothetical protein
MLAPRVKIASLFCEFRQLAEWEKTVPPSSASAHQEYLTRTQLAEFLTTRGYPISRSTLAKLCAPARGEGPPAVGFWSNRALYDPARALSWAKSRFRRNWRGSGT